MDGVTRDSVSRAEEARELQRGWYGEPLGELFRRLIADLGLNQSRLAAVLGLSAPMLSQLMSGQRAKIGNPDVAQRLQALQELAGQVADGRIDAVEAAGRMAEIRESTGSSVLSAGMRRVPGEAGYASAPQVVRGIQTVLRSLAAADEIERAALALAPGHPQLAEFLRVYGAGRTSDAVAHFEAHQD
ncbi:helix-turn-helix transcriptional regulator [Streptomyces sp. HPF1205]|uniref:helix-turn-helix domain-containing protein n=1 Tax=Streptomyces sp. HPF1205 TaxID=2873262 RepID=UPI001CEDD6AC|nr:helix-turn-helix transcriptional regulator [Streptomyces sp. HPF1205]